MVIKVHGSPFSGATLRVLATLHEKELEYEFVHVDMSVGAHKQEPHLSLNPFGQVPAFEDGDLKLFESRAITSYITYAYESNGTPLVYKEPKEMATLAVWLEVEAHQFDRAAIPVAWELVFKKMLGMETDEDAVRENEAKLDIVLDIYETRLAKSKYIGGEAFSLADLHHLPVMHFLFGTQAKKLFDERPHVSAWCHDIMARPSWEKVVAWQKA